jgi:membrane protein
MPNDTPAIYLTEPGWLARRWWMFRRAVLAAYDDNCFGIAKGVAYSSLLAFFPGMTTLTAILVQANAPAVSKQIVELLFEVVPPGTEALVTKFFSQRGAQPVWLLVVAVLLSVWAASGAMISLMEGFQNAHRLPTGRHFLKQRGVAALLVFCVAIPVVAASALMLAGQDGEQAVLYWTGFFEEGRMLQPWILLVGRVVRYLVAFGGIALSTALLYLIGPNTKVRFRDVWPGALVATVLWLLATAGFGWYVRNIANYNVLYGSIAAAIALLVWMYLLSVIAFIGCEYNVQRQRYFVLRAGRHIRTQAA